MKYENWYKANNIVSTIKKLSYDLEDLEEGQFETFESVCVTCRWRDISRAKDSTKKQVLDILKADFVSQINNLKSELENL